MMQRALRTIKRILWVAWIGLVYDYKVKRKDKSDDEDGYERQRVVYIARPLMQKEQQ